MTTEGDFETGGRVRVQETRGGGAGHKEGHGRESQSGQLKMLNIMKMMGATGVMRIMTLRNRLRIMRIIRILK